MIQDSSQKKPYDLFVIGGGSGGVRAARWSASLGARVAICEEDRYGGTCVIRGCVPKKLMVYASHFREDWATAKGYGWQMSEPVFDWSGFKKARDEEVSRLSGIYERLLGNHQVEIIRGRGQIEAPGYVRVGDEVYEAKQILIATGSRAFLPEIPGIELAITSNELFDLEESPKSILIYGVGYIGLEFASILNGFGSEVTVVGRSDCLLRNFDRETARFLIEELRKKGIKFYLNTQVTSLEKRNDLVFANTQSHSTAETPPALGAEAVLMATGRIPNTSGLGLEDLGVHLRENGAIEVNENYETSVEGILAIGDCTDRKNLTPIATAEGTALAERLFGNKKLHVDYEFTPSAVFTQPPLATVGYSEEEARVRYGEIDVYQTDFRSLKHALSGVDEHFFVKLIVETKTQRVVGAHAVGADSPEMMQGIAIAIQAGAKKSDFDNTIGIHPTIAEEFCTLRNKRA